MQARGLEWAFRLVVEPRRLWRRYATCVPVYLVLLAREYLKLRIHRLTIHVNSGGSLTCR
jgi:N-acetylglucosaminyldiphosphoundecaprenol N-acetyl-beta-D-mannosaminyltransferase